MWGWGIKGKHLIGTILVFSIRVIKKCNHDSTFWLDPLAGVIMKVSCEKLMSLRLNCNITHVEELTKLQPHYILDFSKSINRWKIIGILPHLHHCLEYNLSCFLQTVSLFYFCLQIYFEKTYSFCIWWDSPFDVGSFYIWKELTNYVTTIFTYF